MTAVPLQPMPVSADRLIRVMIVDDAVVVRGLLSRWLVEAGGIEVISTHRSGAEAVQAIEHACPDVIVLDIDMPDMDGITALPLLLRKLPKVAVIIASTLTTRNAEISIRCLSMGALDYIAKPSTNRDVTFSTDFRRDIVEKVKALGQCKAITEAPSVIPPRLHDGPRPVQGQTTPPVMAARVTQAFNLRPFSNSPPRALIIGASTGGPHAITELLRECRPALKKLPVIIAQHMPAMFTAIFAEHLARQLSFDASEAQHGELIEAGRIYIAPGGKHLRLDRHQTNIRALLDNSPPVNFCRPSVDITFQSACDAYGPGTLAVMLTGMGTDGLKGSMDIVERGGTILAQDEATSIVWGMPGAVAKKNLCAAVLPVAELASMIKRLSLGERP
ncbi:MAG: chemotaxis-specific protein-glutamate methyltransferase CheB [Beijerinckiaceae bacterium]